MVTKLNFSFSPSSINSIADDNVRNLALFSYGILYNWNFGRCSEDVVLVYSQRTNMVNISILSLLLFLKT